MRTVSQSDHINATAAADILGCSVATVKRKAKDGDLPYAFKLPGKTGSYVFLRSEIQALAEGVAA